jgi:hypothetical protein
LRFIPWSGRSPDAEVSGILGHLDSPPGNAKRFGIVEPEFERFSKCLEPGRVFSRFHMIGVVNLREETLALGEELE